MKRFGLGYYFLILVLIACSAQGPKELSTEQVRKDVLAAAYVKNCLRQGLQLLEAQIVSQKVVQNGLEVLASLHFEGNETPQTKALLCIPVSTVKIHYGYQDGQAVFKRLSLELSRSQLNRFREKK